MELYKYYEIKCLRPLKILPGTKTSGMVLFSKYCRIKKCGPLRVQISIQAPNQEQVTYLQKNLYDSLFPNGNGIGKYIEVKGSPFKVIGMESTEQSGLTAGADRVAYIPLQQWHRLFEELNVNPEVTVQTLKQMI